MRGETMRDKQSELPENMRKLMWKMLREGATLEDTAEALNERTSEAISLKAVQEFFRKNPRVQQERIRHQLAAAQQLKKALRNPNSAQAELAEAALFTGLMALSRRGLRFQFPQTAPPAAKSAKPQPESRPGKTAGR